MSFWEGIFAKKKLKRPRKQGGCKRTPFCVSKKRQFLRYMGGLQAKSACKPWGVIRVQLTMIQKTRPSYKNKEKMINNTKPQTFDNNRKQTYENAYKTIKIKP